MANQNNKEWVAVTKLKQLMVDAIQSKNCRAYCSDSGVSVLFIGFEFYYYLEGKEASINQVLIELCDIPF